VELFYLSEDGDTPTTVPDLVEMAPAEQENVTNLGSDRALNPTPTAILYTSIKPYTLPYTSICYLFS
jgi:hypothetical protein